LQGVSTLVRAVQTFIDRRGVSVHAHEFGKAKLIQARPDQDAHVAEMPSDGGLPPIVESPAVVITPVQLMPVSQLPVELRSLLFNNNFLYRRVT